MEEDQTSQYSILDLLKSSQKKKKKPVKLTGYSKKPLWMLSSRLEKVIDTLKKKIINKVKKVKGINKKAPALIDSDKDYVTDQDVYDGVIETLQEVHNSILPTLNEEEFVKAYLLRVVEANQATAIQNVHKVFSVDISSIIKSEGHTEFIAKRLQENVDLIQSIQNDFINDIGNLVYKNYISGSRHTNIIEQIQERGELWFTRSRLIARDQTFKLHADIDEARNLRLGLKWYIWQTAQDSRVRESHRVLNKKLCTYENDSIYSDDNGQTWKDRRDIGGYIGKIGKDYQCRCIAMPIIPSDL